MNIIHIGTLAAIAVLLPTAASAGAGSAPSSSAVASTKVVQPIKITCGEGMNWGKLVPLPDASATVVMPANGKPLVDLQNVVVPGTREGAQPANCSVTGEANLNYTVTLPPNTKLKNGSAEMLLTAFTVSELLDEDGSPVLNPLLRQLGSAGSGGFGVGATLTIPAKSPAGLYVGKIPVTVQYD